MKRRLALAFIAATMSGCPAHWEELKKAEHEQYFVLAKDYTRTQIRGIGYKWVEGLRVGVYTLAAEDEDGVYFRGQGNCVIYLNEDHANEYLKTGKARGLSGGLWLPKKGVDKDPKLFFVKGDEVGAQAAASTSATTAMGPPATVAGGVGAGVGGALVGAIIAGGKGEVLFINYGSEKDFVAGLKILDK